MNRKFYILLFLFITAHGEMSSQEKEKDSLEQQYIEMAKILFEEKVINIDELKVLFYDGNHCYLGNRCDLIGPDNYLTFTHKEDTINLWPEKKIFFDLIPTWVRLYGCEYNPLICSMNYEIILSDSIRTVGHLQFKRKNSEWKLKKHYEKEVIPPVYSYFGPLKEKE